MTNGTHSVVTHQSWFSRIIGSIVGILLGIVLVCGSVWLLFWNEGRAVKTAQSIEEGRNAVITVASGLIDPANRGRLVHVVGMVVTDEELIDMDFDISLNALRLKRVVEMYQWDEDSSSKTTNKVGGGTTTKTTYRYDKVWRSSVIDSSRFQKQGYTNPTSMPYQNKVYTANDVRLEAFSVPAWLKDQMTNYQPVQIGSVAQAQTAQRLGPNLEVRDGYFFLNGINDPPEIGDVRVSFSYIPSSVMTIVAAQIGSTFEPYKTQVGRSLGILRAGEHSSESVFDSEQATNTMWTWIARGGGFLLMFIAISLIFNPIRVLADVVPLFGRIVGSGLGLISFLLASIGTSATIATGWVVYRPLLGIALFGACGLLFIFIPMLLRKKKVPAPS